MIRGGLRTKHDIVNAIADLLGVEAPRMSSGSTEPRAIFELVVETFGIDLAFGPGKTKPELAQAIVESAGFPWLATFESRGGTVTKDGLLAVLDAVRFFRGE